jgi:hypothetical protein
MTTSLSPGRHPRRGQLKLRIGYPEWLPLINKTEVSSGEFIVTTFRVPTGLGDNRFQWGPFRETASYSESQAEVSVKAVCVRGDYLECQFWSKGEPIAKGIFEVCIIAQP